MMKPDCRGTNKFAPRNDDICHPELVSGFCHSHKPQTLKQVQGDNVLCTKSSLDREGALNLSTKFFPLLGRGEKAAFTLAETLIIPGIIGVVAGMTLPTLIQKHRNHVVETRLAKFYSTFNQAIQMSMAEHGDIKTWYSNMNGYVFLTETDENGNLTSEGVSWFNEYVGKYMKISNVIPGRRGISPLFYLSDGSAFSFLNNTLIDVFYYTNYKKCIERYGEMTSINTVIGQM